MKSALGPDDAGYLKLPGKIEQSVHLKDMIQRQNGRPFVEVRAVEKCSGPLYEVSVPAGKRCVFIGLTRAVWVSGWARFDHYRHGSDELVGGKRVDAKRVVCGLGPRVTPAEQVAPAKTFIETGDEGV